MPKKTKLFLKRKIYLHCQSLWVEPEPQLGKRTNRSFSSKRFPFPGNICQKVATWKKNIKREKRLFVSQKPETTKTSFQVSVHPCHGIPLSDKQEPTIDTHNNLDRFQGHSAEQRKTSLNRSDTVQYHLSSILKWQSYRIGNRLVVMMELVRDDR